MGLSQRGSIEFVVSESAFICLKEKQKHVEILFNVTVTASDSSQGELKWVKVNGGEKHRMKAKAYITSLGKPEVEQFIPVEQLSDRQLNEWSLADFLFGLEKESSANITVMEDSKVRIAGSAMSVELVKSCILSSQNNNVISELPIKRSRLESTSTVDENDSAIGEDLSDSLEAVETLLGSLRQEEEQEEDISMSAIANSSSEIKYVVDIVTSLPETSQDFATRFCYFAKLGYSREMYDSAVRKVGEGADSNDLLSELVKLKNSAKELNDERYNEVKPDSRDRRRSSSSIANSKQLRPIIIDGSNVAMSHGKQKIFSCHGIALAVGWFKRRGHKSIYVIIPTWRKEFPSEQYPMSGRDILNTLDEDGHVIYTPSRTIGGKRIVCYDDRYIMKVAFEKDGVIVSNDNFRDLQRENIEWKKVVEERLLMYSFVEDMFMPPDDPHGRHGPTIDELLTVNGSGTKLKLCQYGRFCTYGRQCKYAHPERDSQGETVLRNTPSNCPRPFSEPVPMSDHFCEDFKRVLSLPNLHGTQPVGIYTMHNTTLPPALPSRHPSQQLHAAPPPIPPRTNNVISRGMRTTSESPYAPLPAMAIDQAVMQSRRQPRPPPRQHLDYDTLPLPMPARGHMPPHAGLYGHHQYTNIPNGVYIGNGARRRGGPYDNIPPPGGQAPVYPTRNHGICQHNYYMSRAPPADNGEEDEKPSLPSKRRQKSENVTMSQIDLEKLMAYAKKLDEAKKTELGMSQTSCRESGNEAIMHTVFNVA